ncbi:MAG: hypothetical protein U9N02_04415 [Campylobacterota bacterium]|nr:hypothetical protein [Campylobacterota bacterium]
MNSIKISKQKIFDTQHRVFAYELVHKDDENQPVDLSTGVKETAQLIISSISNQKLDDLLGRRIFAFINVDEKILSRSILDVLDKERFILNISEDIKLDEKIIAKIIQYKKRGFRLSLEHFDSSAEMIKKFRRLFNYIEDKSDFIKYLHLGFTYFQGYGLDKPEIIELKDSKELTQYIAFELIKIIKNDNTTEQLEKFIKKQPDLSYKLVQFINKSKTFNKQIESLIQVITLNGR